jgi:hypothetical protein
MELSTRRRIPEYLCSSGMGAPARQGPYRIAQRIATSGLARSWRPEAIEYCRLAMIQIGQAKHSATVFRLDSVFAHDDGLPCRRIGTTAQTVWAMQSTVGSTGFERYRLISSPVPVESFNKIKTLLAAFCRAVFRNVVHVLATRQ